MRSAERNGSVPASSSATSTKPIMSRRLARSSGSMPCRTVTSAWRRVCRDGGAGPQAQVGVEPAGRGRRVCYGRNVMVVGRHRKSKRPGRRQLGLRVAGAVLLAVSACIHLALYLTGYRSIPTIGWLFLLQVIVGFVLVAGALVTYSRLAAAAGPRSAATCWRSGPGCSGSRRSGPGRGSPPG
jgi:hypothetical protein